MPRFNWDPDFLAEFQALSVQDQEAFLRAKDRRVAALKAGGPLDPGLGVHQLTNHPGIYEFRFSQRGRATFHYLTDARAADAHIFWRRIGGHEIFHNP